MYFMHVKTFLVFEWSKRFSKGRVFTTISIEIFINNIEPNIMYIGFLHSSVRQSEVEARNYLVHIHDSSSIKSQKKTGIFERKFLPDSLATWLSLMDLDGGTRIPTFHCVAFSNVKIWMLKSCHFVLFLLFL